MNTTHLHSGNPGSEGATLVEGDVVVVGINDGMADCTSIGPLVEEPVFSPPVVDEVGLLESALVGSIEGVCVDSGDGGIVGESVGCMLAPP